MGYEFNVPTTILGSTSVSRTSKRKVAVVWRPAWASNPKCDFEIHGTEDFLVSPSVKIAMPRARRPRRSRKAAPARGDLARICLNVGSRFAKRSWQEAKKLTAP